MVLRGGAPGPPAAGFTLVEVLVALVIVALALGACLRAAGALTVAQQRLEQQSYAGWSADNRLAEIRLGKIVPEPGRRELPCPQGRYALICIEEVRATPNASIRRIDVSVFLAGDRDAQLVRRSSFMANIQTLGEAGS